MTAAEKVAREIVSETENMNDPRAAIAARLAPLMEACQGLTTAHNHGDAEDEETAAHRVIRAYAALLEPRP